MDEALVELRKRIARYRVLAHEIHDDDEEAIKRVAALIDELEHQARDN
jgi:hypothetical protein